MSLVSVNLLQISFQTCVRYSTFSAHAVYCNQRLFSLLVAVLLKLAVKPLRISYFIFIKYLKYNKLSKTISGHTVIISMTSKS